MYPCAGQIAFVSGAAAAVGSGVVKVPIAVCIRSVQAGVYPDVVQAARSIIKAAGPRGLFTVRFTTTLLGLLGCFWVIGSRVYPVGRRVFGVRPEEWPKP
jgi:hypothetical protein